MNYLQNHELFTLEDLDAALQGVNEKAGTISAAMKKAEKRMQVITGIQRAVADFKTHKRLSGHRPCLSAVHISTTRCAPPFADSDKS